MWFFRSPEIVFGEGALSHLSTLEGHRALIVTDQNMIRLGLVETVQAQLATAGIESVLFAEVEPNPSLQTTRRGSQEALALDPDWIVAVGGGSCIDAAKSIWIQYERPDLDPDDIAGQHVRRKLDAAKATAQGTGHRFGKQCFTRARDVLDENVPLAQQGDDRELDDRMFADDDMLDIVRDLLGDRLYVFHILAPQACPVR